MSLPGSRTPCRAQPDRLRGELLDRRAVELCFSRIRHLHLDAVTWWHSAGFTDLRCWLAEIGILGCSIDSGSSSGEDGSDAEASDLQDGRGNVVPDSQHDAAHDAARPAQPHNGKAVAPEADDSDTAAEDASSMQDEPEDSNDEIVDAPAAIGIHSAQRDQAASSSSEADEEDDNDDEASEEEGDSDMQPVAAAKQQRKRPAPEPSSSEEEDDEPASARRQAHNPPLQVSEPDDDDDEGEPEAVLRQQRKRPAPRAGKADRNGAKEPAAAASGRRRKKPAPASSSSEEQDDWDEPVAGGAKPQLQEAAPTASSSSEEDDAVQEDTQAEPHGNDADNVRGRAQSQPAHAHGKGPPQSAQPAKAGLKSSKSGDRAGAKPGDNGKTKKGLKRIRKPATVASGNVPQDGQGGAAAAAGDAAAGGPHSGNPQTANHATTGTAVPDAGAGGGLTDGAASPAVAAVPEMTEQQRAATTLSKAERKAARKRKRQSEAMLSGDAPDEADQEPMHSDPGRIGPSKKKAKKASAAEGQPTKAAAAQDDGGGVMSTPATVRSLMCAACP